MTATFASAATFSDCRKYRYRLTRTWGDTPPLVVIGLNPSTADETQDDPTIRRCIGYAKKWGHGGLVMLNLFAFRATDPRDMKATDEPEGGWNDQYLMTETEGRRVLCAWGAHGSYRGRAAFVCRMLAHRNLVALGVTASGEPKHPLYLRADLEPKPFVSLTPAGGGGRGRA